MSIAPVFEKDTSIQAILYIAQHLERSDIHKICKILYFADQMSLSKYGRSITGDTYIAMNYGPVPSNIEDIFKALRGRSYFSAYVDDIRPYFGFANDYILKALKQPDMDYLSGSDVKCLDAAIAKCKDLSFYQLTALSHDYAWSNTSRDGVMSVADILKEAGDSDEYIRFVETDMVLERALL